MSNVHAYYIQQNKKIKNINLFMRNMTVLRLSVKIK